MGFRDALIGAGSGALQAAPSGNPWLIGGNAAFQGILAGASGDEKFNPAPFRDNFNKYRQKTLNDLNPYMDEVGSKAGQSLAARGLGNSPLAVGIAQGSRRKLYGDALRGLNKEEAAMERDIATGQLVDDRQRRNRNQRALMGLAAQAGGLTNTLSNPSPNDPKGIRKIREKLGMGDQNITHEEYYRKMYDAINPNNPLNPNTPRKPTQPLPDSVDPLTLPPTLGAPGTPEKRVPTTTPRAPSQTAPSAPAAPGPGPVDILPPNQRGQIQFGESWIPANGELGKSYSQYKETYDIIAQAIPGGFATIFELFA